VLIWCNIAAFRCRNKESLTATREEKKKEEKEEKRREEKRREEKRREEHNVQLLNITE